MLILKDDLVINLDNVFSMKVGGQGKRCIIFRGSSSHLESEFVFKDNDDAKSAANKIVDAAREKREELEL